MNCPEIEDKLADFVTQRLPAEESRAVEAHLDACGPCLQLRDDLVLIYQIEPPAGEPLAPATPLEDFLSFDEAPRRAPWQIITRVAAVLALGLSLAYAAHRVLDEPEVEWTPLPLPTVTVDLPEMPPTYPVSFWVPTREEAVVLAAFTGKSLLEEYLNPGCPRCIYVDRELHEPGNLKELGDYIGYRRTLQESPPQWVLDGAPAREIPFVLPAIRIEDVSSGQTSRVLFSTASFDYLTILLGEWEELTTHEGGRPRGLSAEQFEDARSRLQSVPVLLERGQFASALETLDTVTRLAPRHRSRFIEIARELATEIGTALDQQVTRLEKLHAGTPAERQQAIDLAGRLLERVDASRRSRLEKLAD